MDVSQKQKIKLIPNVQKYFDGDLKGKTIATWGLAFMPYTVDICKAPTLYDIEELLQQAQKGRHLDLRQQKTRNNFWETRKSSATTIMPVQRVPMRW